MSDGAAERAAAVRQTVDRWWAEVLATGRLPADAAPVQQRLVRAVGRAPLPDGGDAYLKVMTFPRAKDRLRYLFRPLPAEHEARLLRRLAAAGIPVPEVVAVRTARRALLPFRSLLAVRALPVAAGPAPEGAAALRAEAALALAVLRAGVVHGDLNRANFVPLAGGELAVLDFQSARVRSADAADRARIAVAARLLRGHPAVPPIDAARALAEAGLLRADAEFAAAAALAEREQRRWLRGRVVRCLQESTAFTRRLRWNGIEHRRRGELPSGEWRSAPNLRRCWLGEQALHVMEGREPSFPAYFAHWKWLPGTSLVYVPASFSEDRFRKELSVAAGGFARYRWLLEGKPPAEAARILPANGSDRS